MDTQSMTFSPQELRDRLAQDGFVRIPNAIDEATLGKYRHAAQGATELARTGQWPYVRTVPKQFPPWNPSDRAQGIWGVQHLLHPSMPPSYRKTFEESYFNPTIISHATSLLSCTPSDLVMELYNMLITPTHDFALRWHRDDVPPTASPADELTRLQAPMLHAQWNLALYPDRSLIVVPGSHKRARMDMERGADPLEDDMPGQKVVRMEAGDVVFYNNNILHRGVYDKGVQRATLHGTIGFKGVDPARARNILQHGIGDWVGECDLSGLPEEMRETAREMQRRLLDMGKGDDVGFSQTD